MKDCLFSMRYFHCGSPLFAVSERNLGDTCTETSQCSTEHSECTGSGTMTCTCQSGYFTDGNTCSSMLGCYIKSYFIFLFILLVLSFHLNIQYKTI